MNIPITPKRNRCGRERDTTDLQGLIVQLRACGRAGRGSRACPHLRGWQDMATVAHVRGPEHKVQSRREMGDRKCSKGFILNLLRLNFCHVVEWGFQKEITLNVKKKKKNFFHTCPWAWHILSPQQILWLLF